MVWEGFMEKIGFKSETKKAREWRMMIGVKMMKDNDHGTVDDSC